MTTLLVEQHVYLAKMLAGHIGQIGTKTPHIAEGVGSVAFRAGTRRIEGDLEQRSPIAGEHSGDLGERTSIIWDLFYHVLSQHQMHGAIFEEG